jgi:hypothetical protein
MDRLRPFPILADDRAREGIARLRELTGSSDRMRAVLADVNVSAARLAEALRTLGVRPR